jgi:hypothetical protein
VFSCSASCIDILFINHSNGIEDSLIRDVANSFFENNQDLKNRKAQIGQVTIKKRYPINSTE